MGISFTTDSGSRPDHTYEEIRSVALDVISGRETGPYSADQFGNLAICVAAVFLRREKRTTQDHTPTLSNNDKTLLLEVFWDLFRQGVITLGLDGSNSEFPFFRVSSFGKRVLANTDAYFFHDVTTYEQIVTGEVPKVDPVTLVYLKEAMQAFMSGCLLSSSVMVGVATEHTFLLLIDTIKSNPAHEVTFASVYKLTQILPKVNKFKTILDTQMTKLSDDIREDLDTRFNGVLSLIRTFRNDSGHPSGKIVSREQQYVNLQLFVPYCKKMYQLIEHFKLN